MRPTDYANFAGVKLRSERTTLTNLNYVYLIELDFYSTPYYPIYNILIIKQRNCLLFATLSDLKSRYYTLSFKSHLLNLFNYSLIYL